MRVTEKGQATVPKNVRRKLGIVPGNAVEFSLRGDVAILRPAASSDPDREVADFMAHIRRHKGSMNPGGMTGDEFFKLLRN
ncbi:AbrB/MazE/SpoVT family DNA-binding domain-containing protein [Pseudaminobacter sp. NGMCC 1.201702]|uniref:AbrB/MazE/SpoVT family DNA-binding domain-containing protein n=1 Tax=Pseudaminobacter sp. NGMCC 1.201702 TaxID=3391825 RepID=UPI0039EE5732